MLRVVRIKKLQHQQPSPTLSVTFPSNLKVSRNEGASLMCRLTAHLNVERGSKRGGSERKEMEK